MRRRHILCVFIAFILLLAIAAMTSNLVEGTGRLDLSGSNPVELKSATKTFLASVRGRICLTYFVSSKDKMPANMKDVERTMRRLLNSLKQQAPTLIDVSIIDPDLDHIHGAAYASRKAAAPVKLRKVQFDASSEESVWSALEISFNDYPSAVIPFIGAADLAHIQELIVSNLAMMAQPSPAIIGVSAPPEGFTELPKILSSIPLTAASRVDFNNKPILPLGIDLFMWIAPTRVEEQHLRELERFIDTGRSVIIAASDHNITCSRDISVTSCRIERSPYDFGRLTRTFGIGVRSEVVLDSASRPSGSIANFPIYFGAALTDIKALHGFTIGTLQVSSVTALEPDPDLLTQSGFDAQIVSTTSAETRLIADATGVFGQDAIRRSTSVPKQPWVVRLNPKDPWRGSVLLIGTPSVFSDVSLKTPDTSNGLLLKAAAETFTSRDRIARLRIQRRLPQPLPSVSEASRLLWRIWAVAVIPAALMVFGFGRGRTRLTLPHDARLSLPVQGAALAFVMIVSLSAFFETRPISPVDLSASSALSANNTVASLASRVQKPIEADIIVSPARYWPIKHKGLDLQIRTTLRELGIPYRVIHPELLSPEERGRVIASGIEPFTIDRVEEDQTVRSTVWAALRLRTPSLSTSIARIDPRMVGDLRFLVGTALTRLETKRPGPTVGFITDIPRMSSAQAFEEYTQRGSTPPEGSNPFSEVGNLLTRYGYQVRILNPKEPDLSQDLDLVVWLQPRVAVELLPRFGDYLARGGKAFVALQQYKIKQRQYRGRGYDTVYWPEPQTHRFNEYLKTIGISQMGEKAGGPAEILMDRNQGRLALDTRVYQRSRYREMLKQEVVRPFLIRAVGSGLSRESLITEHLGSLLYMWGNRFTLDTAKLSQLGLEAKTLVETSPRPWRFVWDGGWIPEPALSSPSPDQYLEGPLPLAISVTGTFPPTNATNHNAQSSPSAESASRGELILSAGSEMFTDSHLYLDGYQHDRFLLNAVASLAYGEEMAKLQARPVFPPSFEAKSRAFTLSWRFIVICGAPLMLLGYGILWRRSRRRPARCF